MVDVCFYFQIHQPFRLRQYKVFDIGHRHDYFDEEKNREVMEKVAKKCYRPMTRLLLKLVREIPEFKVSFSITGVALEQFEDYAPDVLDLFRELVSTGKVEMLSETYYHSLAFLYSKEEFEEQVELHKKKIQQLFGITPSVFRNTELIFNNELAWYIKQMGYKGVLAEGWDPILEWRSPNFLYTAKTANGLPVLLKNYRLSDDVAFRFGNKQWAEFPLTVDKYTQWLNAVNGNGDVINLFMDYETFGEHQWEDTGIFRFMEHLPREVLKNPDNSFVTPSEAVKKYSAKGELDIHVPLSWADMERDTSAWRGNSMQESSLQKIYELRADIKATGDQGLLDDWRRLTTSDHFYYMCTKWFSDGDVHKYFNPYESPYDSFIIFMNILNDLRLRVDHALMIENKP